MVFSRLANLAREIREEPDLRERARLEARYRELSAGITDLCLDPREVHLRETCTELLGVFAPILSGADMREPETWQRHEWAAFHRQLVIIRKRSAAWLNTSRRFGSERWGASFAAAAEAEPTTAPTSNNSIE